MCIVYACRTLLKCDGDDDKTNEWIMEKMAKINVQCVYDDGNDILWRKHFGVACVCVYVCEFSDWCAVKSMDV